MAQLLRTPGIESQRAAMKKLNFLVGEWTGEARLLRGPGGPTELVQTEEARYRLDGLILTIERVGRTKSDGRPNIRAFGVISYEDETRTFRMRAFNDGRFLETEVRLLEQGEGMTWGFALGQIRTKSVMRINDSGEWTELQEITVGSESPKTFMELVVRRQK